MHRCLLDILACPSCRIGYRLGSHVEQADVVALGFLRCPRCAVLIPILDGLVLFTEPLLQEGQASESALRAMALRLFGSAADFADYQRQKHQRGVLESYAAFAPFNESVRSLEPVLAHASGHLNPGDWILDTWCRTGWSGEWLAGRFPKQRVLALWEGNSSVLGYRGFRHLLGSVQRAGNLDIVFAHPERPLPFCDAAFGLLHGYDSLHRYTLYPFAGECLRVTRDDGALLFPHIHLSNSEPDPFFERGCRQFHGRDYRAWLDRVTAGSPRRGWVFSEAGLFNGPAVAELIDDADTTHYNGMVAILPAPAEPTSDPPVDPAAADAAVEFPPDDCPRRFVASPLFRLNPVRGMARVAPGLFDGAAGHLLERHPVYRARLPGGPVALAERDQLVFLLATVGLTEQAIVAVQPSSAEAMAASLQALADSEMLRPAVISEAAHRLQRFHCNQLLLRKHGILADFWTRIDHGEKELFTLAEGDGFCGRELADFRRRVATVLRARGLAPGDMIAVSVSEHPLLLLAALAAASSGFDVRLLSATDPLPTATTPWLRGDAQAGFSEGLSLPLGLSGDSPSLLALLESVDIDADAEALPLDTGMVEFSLGGAAACCRLADLVDGCEALAHQLEKPLWLVEGRSVFADMSACLWGWSRLEPVRAMLFP